MKTSAWLGSGAILLFGVSGHPGFVDLQLIGLILIARGAVGLWLSTARSQRSRCAVLVKELVVRSARTAEALAADLAGDDRARVPFDELLGQAGQK